MAKLTRYTQLVFGSTAGSNQMAEYGSFAAGTPLTYNGSTITPSIVQALGNYLEGWFGAVLGQNSPAIEDMNALCFLFAYQLTYLMQEGIAEYDASTIYFINSVVNYSGNVYVSLTNNNTGNTPPSIANWKLLSSGVLTKTANYVALGTDDIILANAVGGSFSVTLPAALGLLGKKLTINKVDTSANSVTILRSGSDLILGEVSQVYIAPYTSVTWVSDGVSNWYAI